jgi:hypothetical protein
MQGYIRNKCTIERGLRDLVVCGNIRAFSDWWCSLNNSRHSEIKSANNDKIELDAAFVETTACMERWERLYQPRDVLCFVVQAFRRPNRLVWNYSGV